MILTIDAISTYCIEVAGKSRQVGGVEVVDDDSDKYGEEENGPMAPEMADHLIGLSAERAYYLDRGLPLPEALSLHQHLSRFADEILKLLRLAPNLVECEQLVLASLRRLTIGELSNYDGVILNYLSLPALKVLSLPMPENDLLGFLKRSAPPLQEH
ncbi:hypothetical protein B0H12DRAFT_1242994 [Mycena haematopus]|nr:hypothetical protein B0H12DRAFT_1242994 [Mycena haematopus]